MDNKKRDNTAPVKAKDNKKLFFSGVIVLTVANILVKVIGAFLKVPLQRLLEDEGMGYYSAAYDIYTWFYMISTAGLPVAVSIMISGSRAEGRFKDAKKIFKVVFAIFCTVGFVGMSVMILFSRGFAALYSLPDARWCIIAVAPTLFFICIASAFRGYFQGYQNMVPTAISEVIEAVGKLTLGILFATYALNKGYRFHIVAAFTLVGLAVGSAFGMLYLIIRKIIFNREEASYNAALNVVADDNYATPTKLIVKNLLFIGIPITLSASVMSFTNVIDGMILSSRLQSLGYSTSEVSAKFGNYKTLAVTLFNLPPSLIYPITASIVPVLSAAVAGKKEKLIASTMESSLRVCSLISLPCAFGLSALSYPVLSLLFTDDSARMAAPLLSVLAPSIFCLAMLSVTNSFLQSHKYQVFPIISMVAGAAVKLLSSYFLIGTRGIEMYGAPIGTFLCYLTTMLLNFVFVAKKIGYVPKIGRIFVKPFVSAVICALAAYGCDRLLLEVLPVPDKVITLLSVCFAAVVYLVCIVLLKAVSASDIKLLPKGEKIASVLAKKHIIS